MEAYDLCLEARDGLLYLEPCSDSAGQSFRQREDGTIRPAGGGDCLAVEAGEGQQAGGVSHVRRDLLLTPCESAEPSLSRWVLPGPTPQSWRCPGAGPGYDYRAGSSGCLVCQPVRDWYSRAMAMHTFSS